MNHIADSALDLRNEFHANRMKFGVFVEKIFFCQFLPIMTPLALKVKNFSQNWSSRAEKFLYGESENLVPIRSTDPKILARVVFAEIVS